MPTGLEQVHAVTDQALKHLDAEVRRLNRSAQEARADVATLKQEYADLLEQKTALHTELDQLTERGRQAKADLEAHRAEQIALIEASGKRLDVKITASEEAQQASAIKEQTAQAALSRFLEAKDAFLVKVQKAQDAIEKAVALLSE